MDTLKTVKVGITITGPVMNAVRRHVSERKKQGFRDSISAFFERSVRRGLHEEGKKKKAT